MAPDTHQNDEFTQFVSRTMEAWKVPGLAIAVIHEGTAFAKVFAMYRARREMLKLSRATESQAFLIPQ